MSIKCVQMKLKTKIKVQLTSRPNFCGQGTILQERSNTWRSI